jgi:hypothetical protein
MAAPNKDSWRIWLLAGAGAGGVMLAALALVRVPRPASVSKAAAPAGTVPAASLGLTLNSGKSDMSLFDPTPLFLPTEWNARPNAMAINALREPFTDFSANYTFTDEAARVAFPEAVATPAKPVDALGIGPPEAPFLGLGRVDQNIAAPPPRDALVEIVSLGDGREVLRQALQGVHPPGEVDLYWLEFLAVVAPTGLVGSPALTTSSGVEQVDSFYQNYLVKVLHVGERLAPGFYRIKVGP